MTNEYDFSTWTSFPSSAKLVNEETTKWAHWFLPQISVIPGKTVRAMFKGKVENVNPEKWSQSHLLLQSIRNGEILNWFVAPIPFSTKDWAEYTHEAVVPEGVTTARMMLVGAVRISDKPAITWFDDLVITQNGEAIYENNFTAPLIQAAVGVVLPIVTGLGVVRFGKKG